MDNVSIEIKIGQIEITKTGGQYILLRRALIGYIAQFSHQITDSDLRRLTDTGVIEIIARLQSKSLYFETRCFHSMEMVYLIFADLLKNQPINKIMS